MRNLPQQRYQRWYGNKGDDRNSRRRETYASDADVRSANQQRSRAWRANRAAGAKVEREVYRYVGDKRVRVWSLGQISDMTGYAVSTLRLLVSQDELPEPSLPGKHRYYTGAEVKIIKAKLKKRR